MSKEIRELLKKLKADLLYHQQMHQVDLQICKAGEEKIKELQQRIQEIENDNHKGKV